MKPGDVRIAVFAACWLIVCCAAMGALWVYGNRPGPGAGPAAMDAASLGLPVDRDVPTVVVFAHPRCPCTRATFAQLARLRCRREFATHAYFFEPVDGGASWRGTGLWSMAADIPGMVPVVDPGGTIAARCGATTSGTIALYTPDGLLRFWGGLTASRGHEGDSVGLDAVAALIDGREPGRDRADVFGCSLATPGCAGSPAEVCR